MVQVFRARFLIQKALVHEKVHDGQGGGTNHAWICDHRRFLF